MKVRQHHFFPQVDALRFNMAMLVLIHHAFSVWEDLTGERVWFFEIFHNAGKHAVYVFFVISGFLISGVLFREKIENKSIDVLNFYKRRAFRILPLYILILFISIIFLPLIYSWHPSKNMIWTFPNNQEMWMYVLLLPNLVWVTAGKITGLAHLWSIGAEEQFYLIWPWLIKYIKRFPVILIIGILFYQSVKHLLPLLGPSTEIILKFWNTVPFDALSIGALVSYLYTFQNFPGNWIDKYLSNKYIQLLIFLLWNVFLFKWAYVPYLNLFILAFLSGLMIYIYIALPHNIITFGNKISVHFGKWSYGIYMFHPFILLLLSFPAAYLDLYYSLLFILICSIPLTILVSWFSYTRYENFYLKKLKKK